MPLGHIAEAREDQCRALELAEAQGHTLHALKASMLQCELFPGTESTATLIAMLTKMDPPRECTQPLFARAEGRTSPNH